VPGAADALLARLSRQIVERFPALWPACQQIRRLSTTAGKATVPLDYQAGAVRAFCAQAHRIGLLRAHRYVRHPRPHLCIETNPAPPAQAFFAGGWLERYVRDVAEGSLRRSGQHFASLWNAIVRLPGGEDFEMDYVALVGGRLLWIESKTASYQPALDKYRRVASLLKLGCDSAWLVVSGQRVPDDAVRAMQGLFGLTVIAPGAVESRIRAWLGPKS
jgi:hypothetical protein